MVQTTEEKRKYNRERYHKLKETKIKDYRQSDNWIKSQRVCNWKRSGVIHENFDVLYDKYINTKKCELCERDLTIDKRTTSTTRCLDHDHKTGLFRNIVCNRCNSQMKNK